MTKDCTLRAKLLAAAIPVAFVGGYAGLFQLGAPHNLDDAEKQALVDSAYIQKTQESLDGKGVLFYDPVTKVGTIFNRALKSTDLNPPNTYSSVSHAYNWNSKSIASKDNVKSKMLTFSGSDYKPLYDVDPGLSKICNKHLEGVCESIDSIKDPTVSEQVAQIVEAHKNSQKLTR